MFISKPNPIKIPIFHAIHTLHQNNNNFKFACGISKQPESVVLQFKFVLFDFEKLTCFYKLFI